VHRFKEQLEARFRCWRSPARVSVAEEYLRAPGGGLRSPTQGSPENKRCRAGRRIRSAPFCYLHAIRRSTGMD
jgi:hypothetical protein